jgi:hypothetical protein
MRRASVNRVGAMVALGIALLASGCATERERDRESQEQQSVPRPDWRVGDRWVLKRTTLTGASVIVTHQVVAATREGYTVRVLGLGAETTRQWTPDLHLVREVAADGTVRYEPPLPYFSWPLKLAATWTQDFQLTDGRNDGRYENSWQVGETIEPIETVAGRFYALRVERLSGTQRLETYWYNPRVRYWVRLEDYLRGYVEELVEVKSWSGS